MDFSQFVPELNSKLDINPSHMLKLFHFSTITIFFKQNAVDVDLLTKVKSMTIGQKNPTLMSPSRPNLPTLAKNLVDQA